MDLTSAQSFWTVPTLRRMSGMRPQLPRDSITQPKLRCLPGCGSSSPLSERSGSAYQRLPFAVAHPVEPDRQVARGFACPPRLGRVGERDFDEDVIVVAWPAKSVGNGNLVDVAIARPRSPARDA